LKFGFGAQVHYHEQKRACIVKIQKGTEFPDSFFKNGTLRCPEDSNQYGHGSGDEEMMTYCRCPNHLVASPDLISCTPGKLVKEACNDNKNILCNTYAGLKCTGA
jgi:hypothetical protein